MRKLFLTILSIVGVASVGLGQNDFRSVASGDWNSTATWEEFISGSWVAATKFPTSADGVITVRNHTVTVTADVTVDQAVIEAGGEVIVNGSQLLTVDDGAGNDLTIESGGALSVLYTFDVFDGGNLDVHGVLYNSGTFTIEDPINSTINFLSGSRYVHNINGGSIPIANWDLNSVAEVNNVTSTVPDNPNQAFGHLIWDCPAQSRLLILGLNSSFSGNLSILDTQGQNILLSTVGGTSINIQDLVVSGQSAFSLGGGSGNISLNVTNIDHSGLSFRFNAGGGGARFVNLSGNLTNNGTFNVLAGTLTITGTSQFLGSNPITLNDFTIDVGGSLTANSGAILQLNGLFTNNGSFDANGGTVVFSGTSFAGTLPTFGSVQIEGVFNAPAGLTLTNDFTNNGTFNNDGEQVRFIGPDTKSVNGSSTTNFYDMSVEGGTLNIEGTANLENVMTFSGTPTVDFDGSGSGTFTLMSTETQDASIANTTGATLQGDINIERAIYNLRGDGKAYHMIGFPITGASVAEVQNSGFNVTGAFTGASTTGTQGDGFASIYSHDETVAGDFLNGYTDFPEASGSTSSTFVHGEGYFMFTYDGDAPGTITTRGAVYTGPFSKTLSYTANGNVDTEDEGWHMVANPYPSATSWNSWTTSSTESDAWVWNASASAWVAVTLGSVIPQGQAFFIRALPGGGEVSVTEAAKVTTTENFYRNATLPESQFKIGLNDGTYIDYTYIGFRDGASMNYDGREDASKLLNGYETISSFTADGKSVKINRIGPTNEGSCARVIRLNLEQMNVEEDYSLVFEDINSVLDTVLYLRDKYLGKTVSLQEGLEYSFNINADTLSGSDDRFEIVVGEIPQFVTATSEETCLADFVEIQLTNTEANVEYLIFDDAYNLVKTVEGTGSALSMELTDLSLTDGVNQFSVGGVLEEACDTFNIARLDIKFNDLRSHSILASANVLESSIEGDRYQWYFDGLALPEETSKEITVNEEGQYTVEVVKGACSEISDSFNVGAEILHVAKHLADAVRIYPNPVNDFLSVDLSDFNSVEVKMYTFSGNFVGNWLLSSNKNEIDMSKFEKGTYIVQIESRNIKITKRIIKL